MKTRRCLLFLILCMPYLFGLDTVKGEGSGKVIQVYAGGVAGIEALAQAETSEQFRKDGGGVYLHNSGWATLTHEQQRRVLSIFKDRPVAIELGFKEGAAPWAKRLADGYLSLGIDPNFIAANAFDGNNKPTADQWKRYSTALRDAGLRNTALILPTFEYANFGPNLATLSENTVSKRKDFQEILKTAGGIVLDVPPQYAFSREENYRLWVVDAIHWARQRNLVVVWITSPHHSGDTFLDDTERFLRYLEQQDALPTIIVSENYVAEPADDYPNIVGHEDRPNTTLGVARQLLKTFVGDNETNNEQDGSSYSR